MAAGWRLASSLVRLRDQVNAAYPNRSRASDGTIGDTAHAASASDHNPNGAGVVCAMDLTHDPGNGFDAHALADHLIANRHSNLKYVISNSRIAGAWSGWRWQNYAGSNPHNKHIHVSVGVGSDGRSTPPYDGTQDWSINIKGGSMNPIKGDVDNILGELWGRAPNPEDYGYTNQNWHDFIYGAMGAYPWRDRFDVLQNKYPQAVRDRDNATAIANTRYDHHIQIINTIGVPVNPNESISTAAAIEKVKAVFTQVKTLQDLLTKSNDTIADLQLQIRDMAGGASEEQVQALQKAVDDANKKILEDGKKLEQAYAQVETLSREKAAATETGNLFTRWIGDLINKLAGNKL